MALFTPGERPGEAEGAFRTHHRYLQAWVAATAEHYAPGSWPWMAYVRRVPLGVVAGFEADPFVQRIQRKESDTNLIRQLLFNAWGTELHLALHSQLVAPEDDREILALANQWSVVQAYYAVEKATVALVVAKGQQKPASHDKTRTLYLDHWGYRPYLPWSLVFGAEGIHGPPGGAVLQLDHNWQNVDARNCWAFLSTCLRSTRRNELVDPRLKAVREQKGKERRTEWEKEETARLQGRKKPRVKPEFETGHLTAQEKVAVEEGTRAATFLDYLYRLRIRSNYQDTRMFTEGPTTAREARHMHWCLTRLVEWTLLLNELWIRRYMGASRFDELVDRWLSRRVAASVELGLALRRNLLAGG